jgi:hypothetical protein
MPDMLGDSGKAAAEAAGLCKSPGPRANRVKSPSRMERRRGPALETL